MQRKTAYAIDPHVCRIGFHRRVMVTQLECIGNREFVSSCVHFDKICPSLTICVHYRQFASQKEDARRLFLQNLMRCTTLLDDLRREPGYACRALATNEETAGVQPSRFS